MTIYRINYLARRNPSMTHEQWVPRWREHWRLAARQPESATVRRYIQCEVLHDDARPAHDGAASSEYFSAEARTANRAAVDYHRIMRQDEELVFDSLIERCSFIGEHRVLSGAGTGPFKVIRFLKRRPGLSSEDFARAWSGEHVRRALESSPELLSYAQNLPIEPERPGGWGLDVDGSEELWFDGLRPAIDYARTLPRDSPHFRVAAQVVTNEVILKDVRT
jgi:hypothetical protein